MQNLIEITAKELSLVDDNSLNQNQLAHILKKTPTKFIRERPAKGGGKWLYVSGGYIKKCLNLMFGWDWDFEIVSEVIYKNEVVVKGKLTCRSNGHTITKMQYGNKDIAYKKGSDEYLSIGNDLKAAATDALKKCASEIGIASDIYNSQEFKEVNVVIDNTPLQVSSGELLSKIQSASTYYELDELLNANKKVISKDIVLASELGKRRKELSTTEA